MEKIKAFIDLSRPGNGVMAIIGVLLGFWLSNNTLPIHSLPILCIITFLALSFGNVINDIKDLEGDRINHPNRPIPSGLINKNEALIFMIILILISLGSAYYLSKLHLLVTAIPIILLTIYTLYLKGIPLLGNILVSALVAYTLVFGSLGSEDLGIIVVPAVLAFLLNLEREIIKDIQDKEGDIKTGVKTTAILPDKLIKALLFILSLCYLILLPLPALQAYFSKVYLIISILIILPVHLFISGALLKLVKKISPKTISKLIKVEMLLGLAALAIDKILI